MDFAIKPPDQAKQQAALVVIRGTLESGCHPGSGTRQLVHNNFLVEAVQLIHDNDVEAAKTALLKVIALIALAWQRGWGETRESWLAGQR